jgi:LAO/AO transport system kinase
VAQRQLQGAISLLRHASPHWTPPVLAVSALGNQGIEAFWREVGRYRDAMGAAGEFEDKRRRQALDWMWGIIDAALRAQFRHHPAVKAHLPGITRAVTQGTLNPAAAAHRLLDHMKD